MPLRLSAALLCLCTLLGGCGDDEPEPRLVGVVLRSTEGAFFEQLTKGVRASAADHGLRVELRSSGGDTAAEARLLQGFVTAGAHAVVICPADANSVAGGLAPLAEARIPVFTVEIGAKGADVVSHIARDHRGAGRRAAEALIEAMGGKGQVLLLTHPTSSPLVARAEGFEAALGGHAGVSIVAREVGDASVASAQAHVAATLKRYPYLGGVFAIDPRGVEGALAALALEEGAQVAVVGCGTNAAAAAALTSDGALRALVVHRPARIGTAALDAVAAHLAGDPVAAGIDAPAEVLTPAAGAR